MASTSSQSWENHFLLFYSEMKGNIRAAKFYIYQSKWDERKIMVNNRSAKWLLWPVSRFCLRNHMDWLRTIMKPPMPVNFYILSEAQAHQIWEILFWKTSAPTCPPYLFLSSSDFLI
jgi:G:T/U-mismatch repair DNA glycosylase